MWPAGSLTNCGRKATKKTIVFGLVSAHDEADPQRAAGPRRPDRAEVDGVERGPGVAAVPDRLDAELDDVRRPDELEHRVGVRAGGDDRAEADRDREHLGDQTEGVADDREQRLAATDASGRGRS